jgi:hypothetical protein
LEILVFRDAVDKTRVTLESPSTESFCQALNLTPNHAKILTWHEIKNRENAPSETIQLDKIETGKTGAKRRRKPPFLFLWPAP